MVEVILLTALEITSGDGEAVGAVIKRTSAPNSQYYCK